MKTVTPFQKTGSWLPMLTWGILFTGLSVGLGSCVGARFDQVAVDNASMLGSKLPALMEKATKPYKDNEAEAQSLVAKVSDAYNHAAAAAKNKDVAEQWRLLRDDLVQPFINRWKEKSKLDKDFITPAVKQVNDALAAIERAEKSKPK